MVVVRPGMVRAETDDRAQPNEQRRAQDAVRLLEPRRPDGDLTPWDEFHFPFDRDLRNRGDLAAEPVERWRSEGPEVEETYSCAAAGTVEVTVKDLSDGFARSYRLGRV